MLEDGEKSPVGTPLPGICVGAQLLMELGQEDGPHQGWDGLPEKSAGLSTNSRFHRLAGTRSKSKPDPLFQGLRDRSHFYFVHSYHLRPNDPEVVLGETEYGYPFTSVVRKDNVWGSKPHPRRASKQVCSYLQNLTLTSTAQGFDKITDSKLIKICS